MEPKGLNDVAVAWSTPMSTFPPQTVVENNLSSVDDIKDQLRLLVNEVSRAVCCVNSSSLLFALFLLVLTADSKSSISLG